MRALGLVPLEVDAEGSSPSVLSGLVGGEWFDPSDLDELGPCGLDGSDVDVEELGDP
jgi:hypothetical protein